MAYTISYVGGSQFKMKIDGKKAPLLITRAKLDQLLSEKKVRLISERTYREICAEILPDGSTPTHNANGTLKSAKQKTLEQLEAEGYTSDPNKKKSKKKTKKKPVLRPEDVMDSIDEFDSSAPHEPVPLTKTEQKNAPQEPLAADTAAVAVAQAVPQQALVSQQPDQREQRAGDVTQESDQQQMEQTVMPQMGQSDPYQQQPMTSSGAQSSVRMQGDLNGDGIVDEFDDIIKEEQKKNVLVMMIFFGGIIVSLLLFFSLHGVIAGLMEGPLSFLAGGGEAPIEQVEDEPGDSQEVSSDGGNLTYSTYKREDFDPEDAVRDLPTADMEHEKMATAVMQAIRRAFINAQWEANEGEGYLANVDIDRIAAQIAEGYAEEAQLVQGLTDVEKEETRNYWRDILVNQERQHLIDKDVFGSIFGGRIREIKQDPENPDRLYVVTEAITGDHQRACFGLNRDTKTGNWKIVDILQPREYAKMIQRGKIDDEGQQ